MQKIDKPNYTDVPNIIFDVWMEKLNAEEFKVFLYIYQKSIRCLKEECLLLDMYQHTGLSEVILIKSLYSLIDKGLLNEIKIKYEVKVRDVLIQFQICMEALND